MYAIRSVITEDRLKRYRRTVQFWCSVLIYQWLLKETFELLKKHLDSKMLRLFQQLVTFT
jgi:hypothetical protein